MAPSKKKIIQTLSTSLPKKSKSSSVKFKKYLENFWSDWYPLAHCATVDQYPKLIFNLVDQYFLLLVEILIHQFFCSLEERVPIIFFRWCKILSRTIWVDSLTLLFPISKIHSKQNFRQRPDHCDRTPCIYTVQMHKQCFKTFFALWFSHQLNVLRTFFAQSYFLKNLIRIWS